MSGNSVFDSTTLKCFTLLFTVGGAGHSSDQMGAEMDPSLFLSARLRTHALLCCESHSSSYI